MPDIINYEIAALQTVTRQVSLTDDEQLDRDIRTNIKRICELIDYVTSFGNSDVKLVVTPEYAVNGNFRVIDLDAWCAIATTVPGPLHRHLCREGQSAQDLPGRRTCSKCIPIFRAASSTARCCSGPTATS